MDQAVLEPEQQERTNGHGANRPMSGHRWADRLLESRVQDALEEAGYGALREIGVTVDAGEVVLRGRLPSYYLTQLALTKAMRIDGITRVRNEIQVHSHN